MKRIVSIIICVFLIFSSSIMLNGVQEDVEGKDIENNLNYTPHAPIRIDSDADFPGIASAGDGSEGSPWIIENWDINGTDYRYCIYIGNTTEHYIIRNCFLHDATGSWNWPYYYATGLTGYYSHNATIENNIMNNNQMNGIYYTNSNNVILENNTANNNSQFGITISSSVSSQLYNNTASYNVGHGMDVGGSTNVKIERMIAEYNQEFGISCGGSSGTIIRNSTLNDNLQSAINMFDCDHAHLSDNNMVNNGIMINTVDLNCANTHSIDTSNTLNGKPVYYYKNDTGKMVPPGAGQVILANCSFMNITNQNVSDGTVGILLLFSTNNTIENCTANSNNRMGMRIYYGSSSNKISNSTLNSNMYGILIHYSNNCSVNNNQINGNQDGIMLTGAVYSQITNNEIFDSVSKGIDISFDSDFNTIRNNIVKNSSYGMYLLHSNNNTIQQNTIKDNWRGIYITSSNTYDNTISQNNILNNDLQAFDDGTNFWNKGYPDGGNYWSDYTGVDNNSTATQDVPPSDGIGDTPYIVASYISFFIANETIYGPSTGAEPDTSIYSFANGNITWSYLMLYDGDWANMKYLWEGSDYTLNTTTGEFTINSTWYPLGVDWFIFGHYEFVDYSSPIKDNYPLMAPHGPTVDLSIVDEDIIFSDPNPSLGEEITISAEIFNENQDLVTFNIPIAGLGWNFISFPVDVSGYIQTVLDDSIFGDSGTTWNLAKWHNPFDAADPWKLYRQEGGPGDLITIDNTMGIWINITGNGGDAKLTVRGREPAKTTTPLGTQWLSYPSPWLYGWNMVGFPATESTNMTAGDVKALTGYNVTEILTYEGNSSSQNVPTDNYTTLNDADYLTRGKAYWFNVSENCSWTVDNNLPEIPDASATVSFYLDSISEANLIDRQYNVQVPGYGSTTVTANWTINVTGNHTIIVDVTDIDPTDRNMLNNTAQKDITIVTVSLFNITLTPGWNLISLPLIQSDESLESVLSSIDGKWDRIMTYDPLDPNPWQSTATYKPDNLNEIDILDHKTGFWIHILPPETSTHAYTYENVSQATNDHFAWSLDVNEASDSEFKNPNSQTEFANFRYTQIVSSDDTRASSLDPGEDDEIFTMSSFNISENPAEISRINMTMEIQGNMATEFQVWVFNALSDTWVPLGASVWTPADTDIVLERVIETNCTDYISVNGTFLWGCYQTNSSELVRVDYMGIEIHSGSFGNTILTVTGTIPESTDIPLYAGWNLVSYPTLNDTMKVSLAFFGTGADRVEVCDPAEPYLIKEVGPTYVMQPGEGYWVHVPADTVWTVDW